MIFRISDDGDLPAVGSYHVTFRYAFSRVIGAFGVNVWLESEEELFDGRLVEDRDVRYRLECSYNFCPFLRGEHWPARAFLNGDLFVGIDADDEYVAELARACEIAYVSDV